MKNQVAKLVGGNIKLGNMGTFSKLMGNEDFFVKQLGLVIKGSCGGHCEGCKYSCYVRKSYRYPSVVLRHAINTFQFRQDLKKAFDDIDGQLTKKRVPFKFVRINQSGEIESYLELLLWYELAKKHPETKFYIYTKNYDCVRTLLSQVSEIANFTINISIWGNQGINEFLEFQSNDMIKAFVYIDETYTESWYQERGIEVQTYCKAYDENGKLDHNLTCDKCQKCINHSKATKIIGCHSH